MEGNQILPSTALGTDQKKHVDEVVGMGNFSKAWERASQGLDMPSHIVRRTK